MKKKKQNYFKHGGETTPQYFCSKCNHAHTRHSKIGIKHLEFERK
jgi:hypothetical protein|tara:strand:- start:9846 stop:9980 length:135 start_codon:yes stop_codon:yes gene_type:complete